MPRAQRRYGYFVMPILHGERLIGRVDLRVDRTAKRLMVQALHLDAEVVPTSELVRAVEEALTRLAVFLGASALMDDRRPDLLTSRANGWARMLLRTMVANESVAARMAQHREENTHMTGKSANVAVGMAVLDAAAAPVGHVQEVDDSVLRIRLQRDIYVPHEVIRQVSDQHVALELHTDGLKPVPDERAAEAAQPTPPDRSDTSEVCSACGRRLKSDPARPVLRKGDARLCRDCWSQLSAPQVDGVVQEVALRGVPLS